MVWTRGLPGPGAPRPRPSGTYARSAFIVGAAGPGFDSRQLHDPRPRSTDPPSGTVGSDDTARDHQGPRTVLVHANCAASTLRRAASRRVAAVHDARHGRAPDRSGQGPSPFPAGGPTVSTTTMCSVSLRVEPCPPSASDRWGRDRRSPPGSPHIHRVLRRARRSTTKGAVSRPRRGRPR